MIENTPAEFRITVDPQRALTVLSGHVFAGPEACIRELIANASDGLSEADPSDVGYPEIRLLPELHGVLVISDNGRGMTESDVSSKLLTLFATSKERKDSLIGRFGIGFYSCFSLCNKVEVYTRARLPESVGVVAVYSGGQSVSVSRAQNLRLGTTIRLHLKEEHKQLLSERALACLVKKFCNFVRFPIYVGHGRNPVNVMGAPWYCEASEGDLREGLRVNFDAQNIFVIIPIREYSAPCDPDPRVQGVLFIQSRSEGASFRLYSSRIFVSESETGLLDESLRLFLSGVVDAPELPLVISRDNFLRNSGQFEALKRILVEQLAGGLSRRARMRRSDFVRLMTEHGPAIKKACTQHAQLLSALRDHFPYRSSMRDNVTIPEYLASRKDNTVIYADDMTTAAGLLPLYRQENLEVLFMPDAIDDMLRENWTVRENKIEFKRIDVDPPHVQQSSDTEAPDLEALRLLFCSCGEESMGVELRSLGVEGPAAVLSVAEDERKAMQLAEVVRILKQQGRLVELPREFQDLAEAGILEGLAKFAPKILILNKSNDVVNLLICRLKTHAVIENHQTTTLVAKFLLNQALLSSGLQISPDRLVQISQNLTELIALLLRRGSETCAI